MTSIYRNMNRCQHWTAALKIKFSVALLINSTRIIHILLKITKLRLMQLVEKLFWLYGLSKTHRFNTFNYKLFSFTFHALRKSQKFLFWYRTSDETQNFLSLVICCFFQLWFINETKQFFAPNKPNLHCFYLSQKRLTDSYNRQNSIASNLSLILISHCFWSFVCFESFGSMISSSTGVCLYIQLIIFCWSCSSVFMSKHFSVYCFT